MNEKQKLFTRHSIGTRIAALFMLLILVITGVMTYVSISVSTSELLDSSTDYTEQLILRVNAELDMYVEYMKDISDFIVDNGACCARRAIRPPSRPWLIRPGGGQTSPAPTSRNGPPDLTAGASC